MKILIAIGSKEFSKPTLNLGMKVAQAFNAKTDHHRCRRKDK